jgi:hypothetical protein
MKAYRNQRNAPPTGSDAECHYCRRPGILTCQYVIPNQWSEEKKAFVRKPWVFRNYYCRWHLAAENHPKRLKRFSSRKSARLEFRPDPELIAEYEALGPEVDLARVVLELTWKIANGLEEMP